MKSTAGANDTRQTAFKMAVQWFVYLNGAVPEDGEKMCGMGDEAQMRLLFAKIRRGDERFKDGMEYQYILRLVKVETDEEGTVVHDECIEHEDLSKQNWHIVMMKEFYGDD